MSRKEDGEATVKNVFGGALYQQGRGYYVGLELFAILRGLSQADRPLFAAPGEKLRYLRRTHDFARRLAADPTDLDREQLQRIHPDAVGPMRAMLNGLVVPIAGMRGEPTWWNRHFQPYIGELIHYDAVTRKSKVSMERYTYRGGGALVHAMLASDPDLDRRRVIEHGLRDLVADSGSQLGKLANAFLALDSVGVADFADPVAAETTIQEGRWVEVARRGAYNIVSARNLLRSRKVDALMALSPLCAAMHALERADAELGTSPTRTLVVDMRHGNSQLRGLARDDLSRATAAIRESLGVAAQRAGHAALLQDAQTWRDGPKTFFTTTLAGIGALNSLSGQRFFKFSPAMLEALVVALVPAEVTFDRFVDELFDATSFVLGGAPAARAGRLVQADRTEFERNEEALASALRELGLLRDYSDMTKMVAPWSAGGQS